MWNPILASPVARLERDLARLGARLGALEHAASQLSERDRAGIDPEVSRLDDELWRIDLRIVSRDVDLTLIEIALAVAAAEVSDLEQVVERLRRPPEGARVLRLRSGTPGRRVA